MIALVQRVAHASVVVEGVEVGAVGKGLLALIGVRHDDGPEDLRWIADKLAALRVFPDESGRMNLAIGQLVSEPPATGPGSASSGVGILLVPNFTLCASTAKGNRPSFTEAMQPALAEPMFDQLVAILSTKVHHVAAGRFGADMKIALLNDGPVTLILDSKQR